MSSPLRVLLKRGENLSIVVEVNRSPYWEIATHILSTIIEQAEDCGLEAKTIEDILCALLDDRPRPLQ